MNTYRLILKRESGDLECSLCIGQREYLEGEEYDFLHPLEKEQLTGKRKKRTQSILLGKDVGKRAFSDLHPKHPKSNSFYVTKGVLEHPVIYTDFANNHHLSITHSEDVGAAVCFPEEHPMGIDIETLSHIKPRAVASQSTEKELKLFNDVFGEEKLAAAYLWTIKEAMSKVIKTGLMIDFKYLEVKEITEKNGVHTAFFSSFYQYKAVSFRKNDWVCSLVFPYKSELDLSEVLK